MNIHFTATLWIGCCLLLMLTLSCRKDLCYHHDEHSYSVKVHTQYTWEQEWERAYEHQWQQQWPLDWDIRYNDLRPSIGTGVRSVIYQKGKAPAENNLPSTGGRLPLSEGISDILFYNNDTEYIVFSDLSAASTAVATTRTVIRNGFSGFNTADRTMNPPDMLYGHYAKDYMAERTWEPVPFPVEMRPLVYTYLIRYEFKKGLQYVALLRGALGGMAERVYLKDGHTDDESSTILYEGKITEYGGEARVQTFGVPNYPGDHYTRGDGESAKFMLNLEVRLKNGKFKQFNFNVTNQLLKQPRGGVIIVKDIEISDEEGNEGTGGFDVEVEGWGDCIDIPLPL